LGGDFYFYIDEQDSDGKGVGETLALPKPSTKSRIVSP